ncbi:MAG: sodium:solute symporter, partial [Duncaniella sp.]|nr:sodium:solute symporter [Duncaniella sp.]
MNIIDLVVFLVFTVGTILFGYLFGRKKQSSDEFTRGGGKVPGWVVGLSIFASFCSSISFLGYCSSAFTGNWNAFVFTISILPAGLLAMRY